MGTVSQHGLKTNMHDFYLSDPFAHPLPVSFIAKVNLIRKNSTISLKNKTNVSGPAVCCMGGGSFMQSYRIEMSCRMSAAFGRKKLRRKCVSALHSRQFTKCCIYRYGNKENFTNRSSGSRLRIFSNLQASKCFWLPVMTLNFVSSLHPATNFMSAGSCQWHFSDFL